VGAAILGFGGGLIGAFFIRINNQINILRKKKLTQKYMKVIESLVLVTLTVTTMYLCVYIKYATATNYSTNTSYC
jgi:H+/Cl- antiporter ClcA